MKMGEEESLRDLGNLGERKFFTLVSEVMRMGKEEGKWPNFAFL